MVEGRKSLKNQKIVKKYEELLRKKILCYCITEYFRGICNSVEGEEQRTEQMGGHQSYRL